MRRLSVSRLPTAASLAWLVSCTFLVNAQPLHASEVLGSGSETVKPLRPLYERFNPDDSGQPQSDEVPDFQKHVSPLLGRMGCNGRACHGSFQGQGGFQLSLFGYDFDADHAALLDADAGRVNLKEKLDSLILTKPTDEDLHEGGKRYETGGWEYWVLRRWIENGAAYSAKNLRKLKRLDVTPGELRFDAEGDAQTLKAIAVWEDGTEEDVTCLCRFQSNDTAIAKIDELGRVTSLEAGDTHVVVSYDNAVVPVLCYRPVSSQSGENFPRIAASTSVDQFVLEKLRKLGIVPSAICSDEQFLRRVSLDVTGTLPSAKEVVEFVADISPQKREIKIEELLSRPSYAAQWTTFLCDITGNNEDQLRNFLPQSVRPENQWYQWIYQRVLENMPYDQIVEGIVTATSRLPGESYREYCETMSEICQDPTGEKFAQRPGLVQFWARNNFKTPEDRAIGFAYSFLGIRIQCAQCHKHPFDQWSKADFDNFERLFGAVDANQNTLSPGAKKLLPEMLAELNVDTSLKGNLLRRELGELLGQGKTVPLPELIVRTERQRGRGNKNDKNNSVPRAKLLGGDWVDMDQSDIRGKLMDWLRAPENPYFAKAIVNRVWAQYFGVGIVNPPDDLNLANAPSNAPLLDYLTAGFVEHNYDLKWLHREIANSDAYQRSWDTNETNVHDRRNFSRSQLRRLPAETTYDAVRMAVTDDRSFEKASNLDLPRAITKPGSSARTVGRDDMSYALTVFGRSVRESNCDCDRSSEPSLLQTVFLVNDDAVHGWLSDPKDSWSSSVAKKFGWSVHATDKPNENVQLQRFVESYRQREQNLRAREKMAQQSGRPKLVEAVKQQRELMLRQTKSAAERNGIEPAELRKLVADRSDRAVEEMTSAQRMTAEQAEWVTENAYLRTLSRLPDEREQTTAVAFLSSEENPVLAVQGLMWALVNTKEFSLNH